MPSRQPSINEPVNISRRIHGLIEWYRWLSIERKASLITTSVLCLLACVLVAGSFEVLRRSFSRMEKASVDQAAERINAGLTLNLEQLSISTRDYASWNDTYEFAKDRNPKYTEVNFANASLSNLKLEAFLLFDTNGVLIAGREVKVPGEYREPGMWIAQFAETARTSASGNGKSIQGMFLKDGVLAYFSSQPILRDDYSGPPRGAIIHVRKFDEGSIRELQMLTSIPLTLKSIPISYDGFASVKPEFRGKGYAWHPSDFEHLRLTVELRDFTNDPIILLEGSIARTVFQEGVRAVSLQAVGIGFITLTAALLIAKLLRILVTRRLASLDAGVRKISDASHLDLNARLPVEGHDEIARLTQQINRLMEALGTAENQRKNNERERDALNAQLQQAQKMEAVGTMAGGIAHDFNNLLCSILGSAELLRHEVSLSPEGNALIRRIEKAGGSAATLIRQLLTFSRRQSSVQKPLRVGETVQDLLHLARTCIPNNIELRCIRHTQDDWIVGDATQLQQVVMNLATNASHAMAGCEHGDFVVHIESVTLPSAGRPETVSLPAGKYIRIRFSDTGTGIPPEALPRIFEPFFTTKPIGSGSGLGLSVVHGIIMRHHGSIGVESTSGKGTSFVVHLPYRYQPAETGDDEMGQRSASVSSPVAPQNILLVDDDSMVREVLAAGLRKRGHNVTAAAGGEEALRFLKDAKLHFDALVTDQMMPGLTGMELGSHAKTLHPNLSMLLISGYADVIDRDSLKSKGFVGLLNKPVTIEQIESAVERPS